MASASPQISLFSPAMSASLSSILGIQPPDAPVAKWHVSPVVDTSAYSFSWLPYLIPALLFTKANAVFFAFIVVSSALTEIHRHLSIPYVFGDRHVVQTYPLRFVFFPLVLVALFVCAPGLSKATWTMTVGETAAVYAQIVVLMQLLRLDGRDQEPSGSVLTPVLAVGLGLPALLVALDLDPGGPWALGTWGFLGALGMSLFLQRSSWRTRGPPEEEPRIWSPWIIAALAGAVLVAPASPDGVRPSVVLNSIAIVTFLWNIWHVFAQKYGILRMYDAKAGDPERVPGGIDRWFVFAWVPLYFTYVGPTQADMFRRKLSRGGVVLEEALNLSTAIMPVAVPLSVLAMVAAHVAWVVHERRAHGLRNRPRLLMALGTTLLGSTFVFFDYRIAFAAFAFSHAVEYIVFLWAYMRKKYAKPLPHNPVLGRVLKRPWLAYGATMIGLGLLVSWASRWGSSISPASARPMFAGHRVSTWFFWWILFQSISHFYWDGFLWKMRRAKVRAHL